jgi:small-conductance mechanosensitive channel
VTVSAFLVSFSFALGGTIRGFVDSVVFIFGSSTFGANDVLIINGKPYSVEGISLLQVLFCLFAKAIE